MWPKRVAVAFMALLSILLLAVVVFVNFFMTSDRLIPIIYSYSNEYLDADVHIESAEGTFFRTFPRLGVRLTNGSLVGNSLHRDALPLGVSSAVGLDSLRSRRDTLLTFGEVILGLDIFEYLRGDARVNLGYGRIDDARVFLYSDTSGRRNYDIVRPSVSESVEADASAEADTSILLNLKHLRINNARIGMFDRASHTGFYIDTLTLSADGDLSLSHLDADIALSSTGFSLVVDSQRYASRLPVQLACHGFYDSRDNKYKTSDATLSIASAMLDIDGWVEPLDNAANMDIAYALKSNRVEDLLAAIPSSVVNAPVEVLDGEMDMHGRVVGHADSLSAPVFTAQARLQNVRAHYADMPDEIDDITGNFNLLIDKQNPDSSYVVFDNLHYKGGKSELQARVAVSQLFSQVFVDCDIDGHVDYENILQVVPFEGLRMTGQSKANISGSFYLDEVLALRLGRSQLNGDLWVSNLDVEADSGRFALQGEGFVRFKTTDSLDLKMQVVKMNLQMPHLTLRVTDLIAGGVVGEPEDSTAVMSLNLQSSIRRAFLRTDTVAILAKHIQTNDEIRPSRLCPSLPFLKADVFADTVFAGIYGIRSFTHNLHVTAWQDALSDSTWTNGSKVETDRLVAISPDYRLPISSDGIRVVQDDSQVRLERGDLRVGGSHVRVTGAVDHLFESIVSHSPVVISLEAEADTLNFNELLGSFVEHKADVNVSNDHVADVVTDAAVAVSRASGDSVALSRRMILFPKNVQFVGNANSSVVLWNNLTMTDVRARLATRDGAIHLQNMKFMMGDASARTTMAYKAWPREGRARAVATTNWERIDVQTLVSTFGLDSLVPALNPMRGKISCRMGVELDLDSMLNVDLSSVCASVHLGGQAVTVLDNEQFAKLSKLLLFKNKKRNIIDTLSVNIIVDDGKVQVLPTVVSMDRYRVCVGGSQDFDMNMNYHVSLLRSPLPFKAGVTISGPLDNLDYDITRAKLKLMALPAMQMHYDSLAEMRRDDVLRDSYVLSGVPMSDRMKARVGGSVSTSKFAIAVLSDNESELQDVDEEADEDVRKLIELQKSTVSAYEKPDSLTNVEHYKAVIEK